MSRFDGKALELSRQAMALFFEPMPGVQLQAKLQNLFISAMEYAEPVTGWIKCSERMPEEDSYVVAAELGHGTIYAAVASCFLHGRFNLMEDGISASNYDGGACIEMNLSITHWMPLPAAPEQEV